LNRPYCNRVCEAKKSPRANPAVPGSGVSAMSISERPRILSGVQSSGKLHIGNYFGAIKQHIERQDSSDCFYFIADYHALTTLKEAEDKERGVAAKTKGMVPRPAAQILRDAVHDAALDYLALGLDPAKA